MQFFWQVYEFYSKFFDYVLVSVQQITFSVQIELFAKILASLYSLGSFALFQK